MAIKLRILPYPNIGRVPSPPPLPPHAHTLLQGEGQLGILTLNKKIRQGNALVFEVSVDVLKTPTRVKS